MAKSKTVLPSDANPLIGELAIDTPNRVVAALRFLSLAASNIGNGYTSLDEKEAYGFSLLLDVCATALTVGNSKGGEA